MYLNLSELSTVQDKGAELLQNFRPKNLIQIDKLLFPNRYCLNNHTTLDKNIIHCCDRKTLQFTIYNLKNTLKLKSLIIICVSTLKSTTETIVPVDVFINNIFLNLNTYQYIKWS